MFIFHRNFSSVVTTCLFSKVFDMHTTKKCEGFFRTKNSRLRLALDGSCLAVLGTWDTGHGAHGCANSADAGFAD